ncbi:MAG: hypothetical protein HAW59_00670 [Betaproteobacteria bacterium]|nr:hypothetical protein [Betaproteobacteria bacterium]
MAGADGRAFGEPPRVADFRSPPPLARRKFLLFALAAALWIFSGIFGRDPWKPQETNFTVIVAEKAGMLSGLPESARPAAVSSVYLDLAAVSAKLFAPLLPLHEGARLINVLLLVGGFLLVGLAAGGGARRGWMAVFLTMGMAGLMVRAHLLNLATPAFFGAAAVLWGGMQLRRHALAGGGIVGGAAAFLYAAGAPSVAAFAVLGVLLALWRKEWRRPSVVAGLAAAAALFAPFALLRPAAEITAQFTPVNGWGAAADLVRVAAWALFPALPVAAAALWRRGCGSAESFLCLSLVAAAAAHFILFGGGEEDLFWLMPPLAVFAARGLEKMPDDYAAILDWFAIIIAGICCVGGMWAAWFLMQGGFFADAWAEWRMRFPLMEMPEIVWWKVLAAALATVLWAGLAANLGRSNERAVLNWSVGVAVIWCVFNLLWTPIIDSGKSHRFMAAEVLAKSGGECVFTSPAAGATAAQLYYFGVKPGGADCPHVLQGATETPPPDFSEVWRGGRYNEKNYVLYRAEN